MTLLDLYVLYNPAPGEVPPASGALARELTRQTERRQQIIALTLVGRSQREIGLALGVSHGTVRYEIRQVMHLLRKAIRGLPRYLNEGRPKDRGYGKKK